LHTGRMPEPHPTFRVVLVVLVGLAMVVAATVGLERPVLRGWCFAGTWPKGCMNNEFYALKTV